MVYPEWYLVERETEKTIKKLTTLEELRFYLGNSDEYIRRLAILRMNELKLKDAIQYLEELLDDHLENTKNKELAAWTIKAISMKWNIDLFINHRLLNRYTGDENLEQIAGVHIVGSPYAFKFSFSKTLINSELQQENDNMFRNQDINFQVRFPAKDWILAWYHEFLSAGKQLLIKLPSIMLKYLIALMVLLYTTIFIKLPKKIYKIASMCFATYRHKKDIQKKHGNYYDGSYVKKMRLTYSARTIFSRFLYVLSSPVRFFARHKSLIFFTMVAAYCFLTFTNTGRALAVQYLGFDLVDVQYKYLHLDMEKMQKYLKNSALQVLDYAWEELSDIGKWLSMKFRQEIGGI
ncbi:HEAT repeat domain-containing protein [Petroclostridium sp. X23]|uniref:HEAT repeat domain-containing protein n=1 Tax=Petroclostridium sp. X23 TaxID=3045146 RepID=UPI0024AD3647|nr:HEAT repeat domain-containing protein [Petroclostridium sp. X23]WHH61076.1 HEAT repeat domain-containing protein [Petroclostridium sp. X23]